jgi:maltose/moltooligosaccharide transporter
MEPYRAFIADKLDDKQMPLGFQMQSFLLVLGNTLSLFIFPMIFIGKTGFAYLYVLSS